MHGARIALVHDWLNQMGGAEGVLETLVSMYPGAPIYTSMYWRERMPEEYRRWDIRTSSLDRIPLTRRRHQWFLPWYPSAFEQFDLAPYDLVISNKSGLCHGVITGPDTLHICYCLTPTRYLWDYPGYVRREGLGRIARVMLPPVLKSLREWDRLAAERVDHFVAISETVKRRIAKYYRRDATVIYPPVRTNAFQPGTQTSDFFLSVGRLIPYKRMDLAVEAFNELGWPLVVIGDGRDAKRLKSMAGPNIRFLGRQPGPVVRDHMARCRGFVFPGLEDFGIAPVEAQAAGRPVIAFAGGGALESVVDGKTGLFFREQTAESLVEALRRLASMRFDPAEIRANAERFSEDVFRARLGEFVEQRYSEFRGQAPSPA
jgi:glycosyltransferase involved in cell wall biosynthesis